MTNTVKASSFPDVVIYDPITEETYFGYRTFAETGQDYGTFGLAGQTLYYVHNICVPNHITLKKGQPFIIRSTTAKVQVFGMLVGSEQEGHSPVALSANFGATGDADAIHYSYTHYAYHLVFAEVHPLDFFEVIDGVRNLYEHKTKEASKKSSS